MKIPSPNFKLMFALTSCVFATQISFAQGPPPGGPPLTPLVAPPAPAGNAITVEKTHLGKALFWDEQLSSTRTMSCGTCHQFSAGGADPRSQLGLASSTNPGLDGVLGTADDITGSPGVVANNADGEFTLDDFFGMAAQVTGRYAPSAVNAGFPNELFWDGRASSQFRDPVTNAVVLTNGAALESQAAGPPLSDVEMAHAGRNWAEIVERIEGSKPLAIATNVPADLVAHIDGRNYPALFEDAFGDDAVTASRIAMAIATYERTLVSNDAPFDDFIANVPNALTAAEERGRQIFNGQGRCATCHAGNRLTNDSFRYIGVRPQNEDIGREAVTGNPNDRGRMKTPTLRNVELKNEFMRNGRFATLADVVAFYNRGGDFNAPNKDPNIRNLNLNGGQQADLVAFLSRPLTDQRLVNETAPFNPPSLFADSANQATLGGATVAGTGGTVPEIVALEPPLKGNPNFTIGISNGLAGANATLIVDDAAIGAGAIPDADAVLFRFDVVLDGTDGFGSVPFAIPADADFDGATLHAKWFVTDVVAANNLAESETATFTVFAESAGDVAAPINVTASDDASQTQIDVTWNAVTGAESYQIFRNDSLAGVASTNSFADTNVSAGESFSYEVVAVTSTEASPKSAADSGSASTEITAPTNLSATDGTDTTKVSLGWTATGGATSYTVFRATTNSSAAASQIGTSASVNYDDLTAAAGTLYFYFVKATNGSSTSEFSLSDSGFRGITVPANLDASDDSNTTHVVLDWDAVTGATSYTIYRGTSEVFAEASELTTVSTNAHNDSTGTPAVIYNYWVTATANGLETGESNTNTGYVSLGSTSTFTASSNRTTDVTLNWATVNGAVNYLVTRSTTSSSTGAGSTSLGLQTGTSYVDEAAAPGTNYNYFIQAHGNNNIVGPENGPIAGLRPLPPLDAPTSVSATDGGVGEDVSVVWTAVGEATNYSVFRALSNDSSATTELGTVSSTTYEDTATLAGTAYFYFVKAHDATRTSAFSASDQGSRGVAVPTNLSATDGTSTADVALTWNAITGADSYTVHRATSNDFGSASQLAAPSTNSHNDTTAEPGVTYFYWVRAVEDGVASAQSTSDSGSRAVTSPTNVSATDGTSTTQIVVGWNAVSSADSYVVFRGTANVFAAASEVGISVTNSYTDSTVTPSEFYFYWITAVDNSTSSAESPSDQGHAAIGTPTSFSASMTNTEQITVNWGTVNGATGFQITRSTDNDPDGGNAVDLGTVAGTSFADTTAEIETNYNYWIQAHGSNSVSGNRIGPVAGFRLEEDDDVDTPDDNASGPGETTAAYESNMAGNYWGLLHDMNAPADTTALLGYAGAKISHNKKTNAGSATITLIYERVRYRIRSAIETDGSLAATFTKRDDAKTVMALALQLVDTDDGGKLVGQLSGDANTTELDLFHREYHSRNNPATEIAGRYTFVFPANLDADPATVPGGDGVAAGSISKSGVAKLSTVLGDGAKTTISAFVGPDRELMFYRTLYKKDAVGFIGGKMTVRETDNISAADGTLQWVKGASADASRYAGGFDIQQPAVASNYTVPNVKAKERVISEFADAEPNALLSFIGGNLGVTDTFKNINWTTANKFKQVDDVTITGNTNIRNGLVSGFYIDATNGFKIRYYAVALQSQGLIVGNFPGTGQSGYVRIEPKDHPALMLTRASSGAEINNGDSLNFGGIGTEAGIGEIDLQLSNIGIGNLKFLSPAELVGDNAGFALVASHPGNIPGGESAVLRLRFDPAAESAETITLRIATNDENNSPLEVVLNGTGIAGNNSIFDHAAGTTHIDEVPANTGVATGAAANWDSATQVGIYQGLLLDPTIANANVGYTSLKISTSKTTGLGVASGTVYLNGKKVILRGTIGADGVFTATMITSGYTADLAIAETANGSQLVGTITEDSSDGTFALTATRSAYHARNNPATNVAGRYTMLLPANANLGSEYPGGDGYATVTIATSGLVKTNYRLGDGSRASAANYLSGDDQWTVFKFLYGSREGYLAGTMTLRETTNISDFDGELDWARPANSKATRFENGFNLRVNAIGSTYTAPEKGERAVSALADAEDNISISLQRADLDVTETTTWNASNRLAKTNTLAAAVNSKFGTVSGTYLNGSSKVKFFGVVFQKQNLVSGMFTNGDETGFVQIAPAILTD